MPQEIKESCFPQPTNNDRVWTPAIFLLAAKITLQKLNMMTCPVPTPVEKGVGQDVFSLSDAEVMLSQPKATLLHLKGRDSPNFEKLPHWEDVNWKYSVSC